MKICFDKESPVDFYFMTTKSNGLFTFTLQTPDIDTLVLHPTFIGAEREEEIWEKAVDVDDNVRKIFESWCKKNNNYHVISDILKKNLDVTQEEIDKAYDRNPELVEYVKSVVEASGSKLDNFEIRILYRKAKKYLNVWNGDKDRAKKFLIEYEIRHLYPDGTLVDIRGEENMNKRFLLRTFHGYWGDELDKLIEEAIEKYPDERDYDYAYYYVRDGLKK